MSNVHNSRVLVTGGTGFLARHVIKGLLDRGFAVRCTLRSLRRQSELAKALNIDPQRIEWAECDLSSDAGWAEAVADCEYIQHTASPFPANQPTDPEIVIRPAVDGTLRVMRAAHAAGVKRVVLTSSMNAIAGGSAQSASKVYNEDDWTNLDDKLTPYDRSKTLAEKAAWDFVAQNPGIELSVINPGAIFGPLIGPEISASGDIIKTMLEGKIPGVPHIGFGPADVRDVAAAQIAAMVAPEAAGRRYICSIDEVWLVDIARILADRYNPQGYNVRARELPDWLVRVGALVSAPLRRAADHLGRRRRVNYEAVRQLLGRDLIGAEEMVSSMADGMIKEKLLSVK